MDIQTKLNQLAGLYALYDETISSFQTACGRGCSFCCTCNVTCTTLEGWYMAEQLIGKDPSAGIDAMVSTTPPNRFQPAITINQMVMLCARGDELPPESNDPDAGPCAWLQDNTCPLYPVRPFACRAMVSTSPCRPGGQACMPPFILSLNNVMMQYLEALDCPGASGNLADVLAFLSRADNRNGYRAQQLQTFEQPLVANHAFPVLMVPPEHRQPMQPFLQRIRAVLMEGM